MAHSRCWGGMHWRTKEWQSSHACQSSGVTREVGEVRSAVAGAKQLDHFVGRTIEDVLLYEDTEIRAVDGEEEHGVAFTYAVVFDLASTRLVFENAFVLDQVIDVYRGPGAEGNLQKPEDGVLACGDIVLSVNGAERGRAWVIGASAARGPGGTDGIGAVESDEVVAWAGMRPERTGPGRGRALDGLRRAGPASGRGAAEKS